MGTTCFALLCGSSLSVGIGHTKTHTIHDCVSSSLGGDKRDRIADLWNAIGMVAFGNHAAIIALCAMMAAKFCLQDL